MARYTSNLNSLHRRAGKSILPDPSLSTEQKMSALGILNLSQQFVYNKGYLCMKFLIIIPQITWHNSLLVTSATTLTPGITFTCQIQGLTYLKLVNPSLERPSGTPCLKISNQVYLFIVSNVICTNICLSITFRQIWTDFIEITRLHKKIECCIHVCP